MDSEKTINNLNITNSSFSEVKSNRQFSKEVVHKSVCGAGIEKNLNSVNIMIPPSQLNINDSLDLKESKLKLPDIQLKSNNGITANNGQKMGSRRIFTPQFKLQVLESYRNDNDCKGNQRATARKYNIHRRQIQKWLQCESALRSSVSNINQNNVKHQFHNLSHSQSHCQTLENQGVSLSSGSNISNIFSQHHQQIQHISSLDSGVIATQRQTSVLNENSTASKNAMSTANLAAVVAAAAAAGAAGAIAITGSLSNNSNSASMSPLRPTAINSAVISSSVLHPQHHSYPLSYTHASIPFAVLPTHHHHHHIHNSTSHYTFDVSSQLHNTLQQHTTSAFVSSSQLPLMSNLADLHTHPSNGVTIACDSAKYEPCHDLFSYKTTKFLLPDRTHDKILNFGEDVCLEKHRLTEENQFPELPSQMKINMNPENYLSSYCERSNIESFMKGVPYNLPITTPIDLSTGSRRDFEVKNYNSPIDSNIKRNFHQKSESSYNKKAIVDLTHKKRKFSSDFHSSEMSEKLSKTEDSDVLDTSQNTTTLNESLQRTKENVYNEEKLDGEQRNLPKLQPKLFKPYLLDDEKDRDKPSTKNSSDHITLHTDSIIWSNYKESFSPKQYDQHEDNSSSPNFQSSALDNYTFQIESPTSPERYSESPMSINSPAHLQCPKGSPVSGYESSSSTYSESNESFTCAENKNFLFRLSMKSVEDASISQNHNNYQRWLDQDKNNVTYPPKHNSSIAVPA